MHNVVIIKQCGLDLFGGFRPEMAEPNREQELPIASLQIDFPGQPYVPVLRTLINVF